VRVTDKLTHYDSYVLNAHLCSFYSVRIGKLYNNAAVSEMFFVYGSQRQQQSCENGHKRKHAEQRL